MSTLGLLISIMGFIDIWVVEAISALLTQFPHRVTSCGKGPVLALTYRQDTQSMCAVGDIVSIVDGRLARTCTRSSSGASSTCYQHAVLAVSRIAKKRVDDDGFVGLLQVLVESSDADCVFSHIASIVALACSHKAFMAWLHFLRRMPHACHMHVRPRLMGKLS
ncbi:hypothetical protein GGI43DRAFT_75202 [Trichoderma evansii]